jgi:DNA-3-methyladenine glycosylase II
VTIAASITPLTDEALVDACRELAERDTSLAAVLARLGPPPMWGRAAGFPTLVHIILEQQVSLASARAAFDRLNAVVSPLTPAGLLALDDATLKQIGFSRQKTGYARHLARLVLAGELDLDRLAALDDDAVRAELLKVKGIGPWSADIYLLMALRRPDVWPTGDLALVAAAREVKGLAAPPTREEMDALGQAWRPWRAVAARLLWHHYLSKRRKTDL